MSIPPRPHNTSTHHTLTPLSSRPSLTLVAQPTYPLFNPHTCYATPHTCYATPHTGEKGRRIRELTSAVQKRFSFPADTVELYAEKVANRGLCAVAQAESLRYKLLGGLAVRRCVCVVCGGNDVWLGCLGAVFTGRELTHPAGRKAG